MAALVLASVGRRGRKGKRETNAVSAHSRKVEETGKTKPCVKLLL
jgi:hypothetical protein